MTVKKPDFLDAEAVKEWERIIPLLKKKGREVERLDDAALAGYCVAVATMIRLIRECSNAPFVVTGAQGGQLANPLYQLQRTAIQEVTRMSKEFGLTPRSRGETAKPTSDDGEIPPGLED